ncbi:hypothetical protein D3C78_409890 [compost metagenome]
MQITQRGFFLGEGRRVAQFAQDFQQAITQLQALGLLDDGRAQYAKGFTPATVGNVDAGAFQGVVAGLDGGRRNELQRNRRLGGGRHRFRLGRGDGLKVRLAMLESHLGLAGGLGVFQFLLLALLTGTAQQHPVQDEQQHQAGHHDGPPEGADAGVALLRCQRLLGGEDGWHQDGLGLGLWGGADRYGDRLGGDVPDLGLQLGHFLFTAAQLLLHGLQTGLQFGDVLTQLRALGFALGQAGIDPLLGLGQLVQARAGCNGGDRSHRLDGSGGGRDRGGRGFGNGNVIRQQQRLAHMQAIDVATGEGIGIQGMDAIQHLLLGHAAADAQALGDQPEAVAPYHLVTLALRGCGGGLGLYRRPARGCDGKGGADRRGAGGVGGRSGRVEQQGVLAQQPAVGASHFDDEIQVRLEDRLIGYHADMAAGAPDNRAEAQVVEEDEAIDAGAVEGLGGGQADLDFTAVEVADLEQFDLGIQWLVEGGVQGDFA